MADFGENLCQRGDKLSMLSGCYGVMLGHGWTGGMGESDPYHIMNN